jgi:hypothetical protein
MTIPPYIIDLSTRNVLRSLPQDLNIETKIALAKFVPEILVGGALQIPSEALQRAIENQRRDLVQSGIILEENLNNFQPRILAPNSVVQGRRQFEISPRQRAIAGKPPLVRELEAKLKELESLRSTILSLDRLNRRIERQIDRITAIVNLPNQIAQAGLTFMIGTLDALDQAYEKTKRAIINAKKAYDKIKKDASDLYNKALDFKRSSKEKIDNLKKKFSKLREIPRRIRFPKRPRLPNINLTRANFFVILRRYIDAIKKKDDVLYRQYYEQFVRDSAFDIEGVEDSDKSEFQKNLARYRNNLIEARARLQATEAVRINAANRLKAEILGDLNSIQRSTESELANISQRVQSRTSTVASKLDRATDSLLNRADVIANTTPRLVEKANSLIEQIG